MQDPNTNSFLNLIASLLVLIGLWRVGFAFVRIAHALEAIAEEARRIGASLAQITNIELPVLVSSVNELSDVVERSAQPLYIENQN